MMVKCDEEKKPTQKENGKNSVQCTGHTTHTHTAMAVTLAPKEREIEKKTDALFSQGLGRN